jgi:WD repeat-containing protein 59
LDPVPSKFRSLDYFSLSRTKNSQVGHIPTTWTRSLPTVSAPALSPSISSRGSWSSLFNTGSVRQFMSGMQDTLKDGLLTSTETPSGITTFPGGLIPLRKVAQVPHALDSPRSKRSSMQSGTPASKSWSDSLPSSLTTFSSAGHTGSPAISQMMGSRKSGMEHRVLVFDQPTHQRSETSPLP